MSISRFIPLLAAGALVVSACGDDKKAEEDPVAEACEHLKDPPSPVTAAAVGDANPPPVAADHKRYEVTLPTAGSGKQGVVKFASTMMGEMQVFLSADVPLTVTSATGTALQAEGGKKTTAPCTELKAWYVYDVEVGTYNLLLGSSTTSAASVGVVIEAGAHEH